MAVSLSSNLPQPYFSVQAKLCSGLMVQSPSSFRIGKSSGNSEFYGKVCRGVRSRACYQKPRRLQIKMMPLGTPRVPYKTPGEATWQWVDLWNALHRERLIFLGEEITDESANQILATMLYLDTIDNFKEMTFYVHCCGGDLAPGMAIYDTMRSLQSPVGTLAFGSAYYMAGLIVAGGKKGHRKSMPKARILLGSPGGGAYGQADIMHNEWKELVRMKGHLLNELVKITGHSIEKINEDISADKYFSAPEAIEYGLIDQIIRPPKVDADKPKNVRRSKRKGLSWS